MSSCSTQDDQQSLYVKAKNQNERHFPRCAFHPNFNIQHSIAAAPPSAGTIPRRPGLWRDKTGLSIAAQSLSPPQPQSVFIRDIRGLKNRKIKKSWTYPDATNLSPEWG
jgi:hypothetical protein